jgi:hypothetical protein
MASAASIQPRTGDSAAARVSWQHGSTATAARAPRRQRQHAIGELAARVARHHQIAGEERNGIEIAGHEPDPILQPRPAGDERRMEHGRRGRNRGVDDERRRRRVVEQQQYLGEQAVPAGEVDDAAAAEPPAHPPGHLPGLEELLARQAPGLADRTAQGIEE